MPELVPGLVSVIVHPPVDIERFNVAEPKERKGFVIAGRQVPQKRFDLAIQACNKTGQQLIVLGKGPEHKRLAAMGGPTISFREQVSDSEMPGLIANAEAFIFPCFDDFGIVPIEAMAAGTPVIAYKAGGALNYVIPGKTGEFFDEQTVPSLRKALRTFDAKRFKAAVIRQHAKGFSPEVFEDKLRQFIDNLPQER